MKTNVVRTVLVIDDEEDDRAMIRRLLLRRSREYRVLEADTGAGGLEALRTEQPECVLLDFYLPDMTGAEFLERLANGFPDGVPLPIAILTGQDDDEVAGRVLKSGAQDYLAKDGLTAPALDRAIQNAIEKFEIRRELLKSRLAVELRNQRLALLRDQLQEKVAELAEATKAKDQFMAVMSHEMRTPLNAIIGYADLLEMGIDGELTSGQQEKVERIRVGGRHLLDLINDVLDLARADANKLQLDIRPVDLGAVLEEVAVLLERQAEEKGLELVLETPTGPIPHVEVDLNRLRQILTNLVGNAIKFTPEGSIRVNMERGTDGTIQVHVTDSGIGIDAEVLPLVFNEFYQARGELTRERGGSGLGLAISKRLARLMGGDIRVRSEPGSGSTFTLVLNASRPGSRLRQEDVQVQAARMESTALTVPPRNPSRPVAVVAFGDRSSALAELKRQVHPGVRLLWTTDPDAVTALAIAERASLVILDIQSSGGAAWKAAEALQNAPELSSTAVLLLPSIPNVRPDEESGGLDLGWLAVVPKPFTAAQLTSAVSTAARGHYPESGRDANEVRSFDVLVVDDDPGLSSGRRQLPRRVRSARAGGTRRRDRAGDACASPVARRRRARPDDAGPRRIRRARHDASRPRPWPTFPSSC
jgi:signal transduction histidine kinase